MKQIVYMRFAKSKKGSGLIVRASTRPCFESLTTGQGISQETVATVSFAVEFDVPDDLFKQAELVLATVDVETKKAKICRPKLTIA